MDNLPTMDTQFAPYLHIVHTFLPPKKGQPLNNGQNARPQCVHYSEVPLYFVSTKDMDTGREGERNERIMVNLASAGSVMFPLKRQRRERTSEP